MIMMIKTYIKFIYYSLNYSPNFYQQSDQHNNDNRMKCNQKKRDRERKKMQFKSSSLID